MFAAHETAVGGTGFFFPPLKSHSWEKGEAEDICSEGVLRAGRERHVAKAIDPNSFTLGWVGCLRHGRDAMND